VFTSLWNESVCSIFLFFLSGSQYHLSGCPGCWSSVSATNFRIMVVIGRLNDPVRYDVYGESAPARRVHLNMMPDDPDENSVTASQFAKNSAIARSAVIPSRNIIPPFCLCLCLCLCLLLLVVVFVVLLYRRLFVYGIYVGTVIYLGYTIFIYFFILRRFA